jgi:hypothetical protein
VTPAVVIGVDGGYLRSRHRRPERNFEVIAGKVLNLDGSQHRFAFARNGDSANEFANAIVSAGVRLGTPATLLSDGDAGLWKLQRQVMPKASLVLDWWHIAMRFKHALQAARGLGAGAASACLLGYLVRDLESAKWNLWLGRSSSCLGGLAMLTIGLTRFMSARCAARSLPAGTSAISSNILMPIVTRWYTMVGGAMRGYRFRPPSSKARSTRSCQSAWAKNSRCDGTDGPCNPFSTYGSLFSIKRSAVRSGDILPFTQRMTTMLRHSQLDEPHYFACSPIYVGCRPVPAASTQQT